MGDLRMPYVVGISPNGHGEPMSPCRCAIGVVCAGMIQRSQYDLILKECS